MAQADQVWVYRISGTSADLDRAARSHLGDPLFHWRFDPARLLVGRGLPDSWLEGGSVFNGLGELRWWTGSAGHEALLVLDKPAAGLEELTGPWTAEDEQVWLVDLREPRVAPSFGAYPMGQPRGWLRVRLCRRDGILVLTSPREFLGREP